MLPSRSEYMMRVTPCARISWTQCLHGRAMQSVSYGFLTLDGSAAFVALSGDRRRGHEAERVQRRAGRPALRAFEIGRRRALARAALLRKLPQRFDLGVPGRRLAHGAAPPGERAPLSAAAADRNNFAAKDDDRDVQRLSRPHAQRVSPRCSDSKFVTTHC